MARGKRYQPEQVVNLDHFQCEKGDAEAATYGVSPQRPQRTSASRRRASRSLQESINVHFARSAEMATIRVACVLVAASIHRDFDIQLRELSNASSSPLAEIGDPREVGVPVLGFR